MTDIKSLIKKIKKFSEDRDWDKFHNYKDLAISLNLEAGEVLEHFQWKTEKEVDKYIKHNKENVSEELADVFIYLLQISDKLGVNLISVANSKLSKTAKKYPVEKAKGNAKKYTEL